MELSRRLQSPTAPSSSLKQQSRCVATVSSQNIPHCLRPMAGPWFFSPRVVDAPAGTRVSLVVTAPQTAFANPLTHKCCVELLSRHIDKCLSAKPGPARTPRIAACALPPTYARGTPQTTSLWYNAAQLPRQPPRRLHLPFLHKLLENRAKNKCMDARAGGGEGKAKRVGRAAGDECFDMRVSSHRKHTPQESRIFILPAASTLKHLLKRYV